MAAPLAYKKNFKVSPLLQLFYTGGPVVLLPGGAFVACACGDEVKIVNIDEGEVVKTFEGDSERITSLAASPDGNWLFSASRSLQVKQWNLVTGSCFRSWKAHEAPIADMAVDSSSGIIATASADRSVLVWDIEGGYCSHAFRGHTGVVKCVIFHPDAHRLLLFSGGEDGTVRVWDLVTKKCVSVLDKHFSDVTSLAVSANGWSLVTGSRDKVVNIWDLRDYSLEVTVPVYESIESICIVPESSDFPGSFVDLNESKAKPQKPRKIIRFLTVGELGIVQVWTSDSAACIFKQTSSERILSACKEDAKTGFIAAVLLPDAKGLMCVTADQQLLFYTPNKLEDGKADLMLSKRLIGSNDEITDLKFLGNDSHVLAIATNVEQVHVYNLHSKTFTHELIGHTDIVLTLDTCFTASGRVLLASGAKDHTVRLWDTEVETCIATASGHMAAVTAVAFSKKHKNFFVSGSSDRTIKLWNFGELLENHDKHIKLSSQAVVAAHDKDINSVAIAPNDSLVCSGSQDRTARVWKLPELILVTTLKGHKRGVWCVEFSPVDQCVLTASGDKSIRIWALSDGSCLKTFEGHTASVLKACFLSRGTQIVSSGADGLLKLWTIKSNECVNTFDHHNDKIWALAVDNRTEVMASGGADSVVNIWVDCTAEDEEAAIQQEEEEVLKDQELANALADTDYIRAIQLGFELQRPFKLLHIFTELLSKNEASVQITMILKDLGTEHRRLLLQYIREWNSKSKFCHTAQGILFYIFRVIPPEQIIQISGISELLEGILPYSQRHLGRIDRLVRSSYLCDYTLACMHVVEPVKSHNLLPDVQGGVSKDLHVSVEPSMKADAGVDISLEQNGHNSVDMETALVNSIPKSKKKRKKLQEGNKIKQSTISMADGLVSSEILGGMQGAGKKSKRKKGVDSQNALQKGKLIEAM